MAEKMSMGESERNWESDKEKVTMVIINLKGGLVDWVAEASEKRKEPHPPPPTPLLLA